MHHKHPGLLFLACIFFISLPVCGCTQRFLAGSDFKEANDYFNHGSYEASLSKYRQISERYPNVEGDRILFQMGMIHSHFRNVQRDYRKSLECFQTLIKDYPESRYREESALMISLIHKEITRDGRMAGLEARIEALERELKSKRRENTGLQKQIEWLEQTVFALKNGPADRVLIEKSGRRLTLFSKDKVLKSYRIALGGDPQGPKEREGDNKTPEGIYSIDSRKKDSRYHLSLHISYPNKQDRKRAKELGTSPGSDIMIHGLKNGFSGIGELHATLDWTQGCIAVTDEEIEEIDKLVPNGTVVEIRP